MSTDKVAEAIELEKTTAFQETANTKPEDKDEEDDKMSFIQKLKMKRKKQKEAQMIPFFKLFRFATKKDYIFILIGTIGSLLNSLMFPLLIVVWTDVLGDFSDFDFNTFCSTNGTNGTNMTTSSNMTGNMTVENTNPTSLAEYISEQTVYLILLGVATTFFSYFQVAFWSISAERQIKRIRNELFRSILKQNIGWYDVYKSGELTTRLSDDVNKIRDGINDKFGNALQYLTTFFVSIIIALVRGWKLTLVIMSTSPVLVVASVAFSVLAGVLTTNELKSYASAGAVAEEVITAIRTVFAFNGGKKELARYESKLEKAKNFGIKKGFFSGGLIGFLWCTIFCIYALGFWYGWKLSTEEEDFGVGDILGVFFLVLVGVFNLGNAGPFINTVSTARAAAFEVFAIIDRIPSIDSSSEKGIKPTDFEGDIEFRDVQFKYPSREDVPVLRETNIKIEAGSTVAFVGHSGCGKSTCVQLIQRFYDTDGGSVLIDGQDVKSYNLKWLRTKIGVVSQEPILFGTTIKENIVFGRAGTTNEEVVEAAKNANAHSFIMKLPDKYDTLVGDRGGQLSGGQKQRIAIARALVRNPRILLLDEATSALDNESESIVQAALDKASEGRTTVIIAHRLTTVKDADVIFAFEHGRIAEYGTHAELMKKQAVYYNLVINQQNLSGKEKDEKERESELSDDFVLQDLKRLDGDQAGKEKKSWKDKLKKKKKTKEEKEKDHSVKKVFMMNKPEWVFIFFGCIASIVQGGLQPAFGVVLSKAISLFSLCTEGEQSEQITIYCLVFLAFAILSLVSQTIGAGMFAISGENLTKRMRAKAFKSMLSQEIGWFDDKDNNVGVLTTKLAVEASAVQGATGVRLGFVLQVLGNLGVGIIIAFVFSWPVTLVILGFIPLMILSGVFQTKLMTGFSSKDKSVLEKAGSISNEAISNIRTVVMLNKEEYFVQKYMDQCNIPFKGAMKSAHINGFMLGLSTSIMFYAMAAAYNLGAYLIDEQLFDTSFEDILIVFNVIIFGAQQIGQVSAFMPDYGKAKASINSMFDLFERVPKINNWDDGKGHKMTDNNYDGTIALEDIDFTYPSRPEAKILNKFNVTINKGQRIALVGSSGCGKSTITQLLERFYDPDAGRITMCDRKLSEFDLYWLRSQIGIVSQEPILFDMTIRENIAYGDNSRTVSMEEVQEAAKKANIHDFIVTLPNKYDTNVGSKGTQLSGGQKQRIAIARALMRDPKILILDEATSALDTQSEKIVQDALNKAQVGRTCIIIAHRLSTVKTCDVIFVIQNGEIVEKGTHEELLEIEDGFYAKLNQQR